MVKIMPETKKVFLYLRHYPGINALKKRFDALGYSVDIAFIGLQAFELIIKKKEIHFSNDTLS